MARPFRKEQETKPIALRLTIDELKDIDTTKEALGMWETRSDLIRDALEYYLKEVKLKAKAINV